MKGFSALSVLAFVAVVIASDRSTVVLSCGDNDRERENGQGEEELSCESKEGCCIDPVDCPGCCNPPYDNQCSNLKGIPLNLCELSGTFFIPYINYDPALFYPSVCPTLNVAGNYPGKCQGSITVNSKIVTQVQVSAPTVKPIVYKNVSIPQNPASISVIRGSSCSQILIQLDSINYTSSNFTRFIEPFLINAVVIARNDAGFAAVACYAIYKSSVLLAYVISPTPKPNPWAMQELLEKLEPFYSYGGSGQLYPVNYTGCYPSLSLLNYTYF